MVCFPRPTLKEARRGSARRSEPLKGAENGWRVAGAGFRQGLAAARRSRVFETALPSYWNDAVCRSAAAWMGAICICSSAVHLRRYGLRAGASASFVVGSRA